MRLYQVIAEATPESWLAIMSEQKKPETERVVLQSRQISQYFSPSATPKEMETSILSMLDTAKEWRSYFPEDSTLDDVNRRMPSSVVISSELTPAGVGETPSQNWP